MVDFRDSAGRGPYDPFGQGYMHDWRIEEAVRLGVQRAIGEMQRYLSQYPPQYYIIQERRPEGIPREQVEAIVAEAVREERERILRVVEEKIVSLVRENMRLREENEKLKRKLEEKGGGNE